MKTYTVQLNKKFGNKISTRDSIRLIADEFEKKMADKLCLDSSNVVFISRAAADELLNFIRDTERKENKQVELKNANKNVKKMLRVVSKGKEGNLIAK